MTAFAAFGQGTLQDIEMRGSAKVFLPEPTTTIAYHDASGDASVGTALAAAKGAESATLGLAEMELTEEALRGMLYETGGRANAAELLRRMASARAGARLRVDETAVGATMRSLGDRFIRCESENFVALSDARVDWINARLGVLERARSEFYRWTDRAGVNAAPHATKLLCVAFARYEDYVAFAKRTDNLDASGMGGYYSHRTNRIVFYDERTGPSAGGSRSERASRVMEAKTIHEAAHMVAFNSAAQSRRRANPLWLSEGLASAFEPVEGSMSLGPDRPSATREAYLKACAQPRSVSIDELVGVLSSKTLDVERARSLYVSSEALVRYLSRHRSDQFTAYMESMATSPAGARTSEQLREEFRAHFGDPAKIEREMRLRPW